jgi:single-stranded DNA-binding protein
MNSVNFTGRICTEPELRDLPDGSKVCRLRVAVDGGARNMETGFVSVLQYGAGGEAAAKTLESGWLIGFSGRLEHRTWKPEGSDTIRESIDFVGRVDFLAPPRPKEEGEPARETSRKPVKAGIESSDIEDVPF